MKINYNSWFYKYHRYLTGVRNGVVGYNDTKWKNMNQVMENLINLESDIIQEQPFGVVSNYNGFDKLIDLMDKSDYTFQDLDSALIDTYKMSFENAMSRMMVNTHAVISHCTNNDKWCVNPDPKNSKYYIVDVPFNQMHFGDRDEMIRQHLSEVYSRQTGYYMPMDRFDSEEISTILGFSFLCTTNGFICNDWEVAVDDKGFHFRILWGRAYDVAFIIYKLDHCVVSKVEGVTINSIKNGTIEGLNIPVGVGCIVDIFTKETRSSSTVAPNFGVMTEDGLVIKNIQDRTIADHVKYPANTTYTVIAYGLKYIFELPNVYPCINFMDMLYAHPIITENGDDVATSTGYDVIGMSYDENTNIPPCTPPISVDRSADTSFNLVLDCLNLKPRMMTLDDKLHEIGRRITSATIVSDIDLYVIPMSEDVLRNLKSMYKTYLSGGIITSLITSVNKWRFEDIINRLTTFIEKAKSEGQQIPMVRSYALKEFYGIYYSELVEQLTGVYDIPALKIFTELDRTKFNQTYIEYDKNTRFNRPISEQCFISLKYSYDEEAWLFTYPELKHFHGIGNTFYIKDGMKENDVFKFFILYTDTEDTSHENIEPFDFSDVFDFDKFSEEIDRYQGYIRYWNVENHVRKLSRVMFDDDATDKQIQVLSKILNGKLNGEEILDLYPTDMNYEESNVTSDNIENYTERSPRAPFAVNFLFYTIAMMYDDKDQLLSYFINKLTKRNYSARYVDIDISDLLNVTSSSILVNYGGYTIDNSTNVNTFDDSNIPDNEFGIMYGIPYVYNTSGNNVVTGAYNYTFTKHGENTRYPFITTDCDIDTTYYVSSANSITTKDYKPTIDFIKLMVKFIDYADDCINVIETRFYHSFDIAQYLDKWIDTMTSYINGLDQLVNKTYFDDEMSMLVGINRIKGILLVLKTNIESLRKSVPTTEINKDMYTYFDMYLKTLKRIYVQYGFDDFANDRISALYYHLKKINSPMNLFEFEKWLADIDLHALSQIPYVMTNNKWNLDKPVQYFENAYEIIVGFIQGTENYTTIIHNIYDLISTIIRDDINDIIDIVFGSIVEGTVAKELYSITGINVASGPTFSSEPRYVVLNATIPNDSGDSSSYKLILVPFSETVSGGYRIRELSPICDYALFTDTLSPTSVVVYDGSGNALSQSTPLLITASVVRVGNTLDTVPDLPLIPGITHTEYTFQHVHEKQLPVGNSIATIKDSNMNYELLAGNKFTTLDYEQEYVLDRSTLLPGPVDIVNLPNDTINKFAKTEYGKHNPPKFFFKPVQVMHNDLNEGVLTSTGGKYHVGQTVYLKTNDEYEFVFPIIITEIDHNISHGFIEATVDYNHARWFNVIDEGLLEQYSKYPIECTVLDDNVSNFMNEFTNADYSTYPVPDMTTSETFIYLGTGDIIAGDTMTVCMINHNFNELTLPEMYPVLRDEPNDHKVHAAEQALFKSKLTVQENRLTELETEYAEVRDQYIVAETEYDRDRLKMQMDALTLKIQYTSDFITRLEDYINQPESKTTWYNLYAYDDAITYINNGRAKLTRVKKFNIRDIVYSDEVDVRLYDWENKTWLDSNDFTISVESVDEMTRDSKDEYITADIQFSFTITPVDPSFHSRKLLVYFVYEASDIYDDIELNPPTVNVRFKPFVSLYESNDQTLYDGIRIRKHFDSHEIYKLTEVYSDDDFSLTNGYYIKRIPRSGRYTDSSVLRWNDMTVKSGLNTYTYNQFDIYERFPFPSVFSDQRVPQTTYVISIDSSIDSFTPNETVTLVCIQQPYFTTNVSTILFKAVTTQSSLQIMDASEHFDLPNGRYICTVAKDPMYKSVGGVVTVTVTNTYSTQIMDANHVWYKVQDPQYKIIPDEFIIVPKSVTLGQTIYIDINNEYSKSTNTISPYTYYYDTSNLVRYPISDIRHNKEYDRLEINMTTNPTVKQIKSNYVGVCRYSLQTIPTDGFIDFTGYIPTPLSRKRYEFWVNGRCVTNTPNLIILSPTAIQLVNLKSLRNFELIELVDNINDSDTVFPTGGVYMDLEGHTFSSYLLMLNSNRNIRYQNIKYRFYWNTKSDLDVYTKGIIPDPNNKNIEVDILDYVSIPDNVTSYNELYNIPTLNGVPIYHPTTNDLGIMEIPAEKINALYDRVWRENICMDPLFPMTHIDLISSTQFIKLHVYEESDCMRITSTGIYNGFFTLFITTSDSSSIENTTETKKIIPMISLGTNVLISKSYQGMYLQCTFPTETIQI